MKIRRILTEEHLATTGVPYNPVVLADENVLAVFQRERLSLEDALRRYMEEKRHYRPCVGLEGDYEFANFHGDDVRDRSLMMNVSRCTMVTKAFIKGVHSMVVAFPHAYRVRVGCRHGRPEDICVVYITQDDISYYYDGTLFPMPWERLRWQNVVY